VMPHSGKLAIPCPEMRRIQMPVFIGARRGTTALFVSWRAFAGYAAYVRYGKNVQTRSCNTALPQGFVPRCSAAD